jgi:hypothetical protein
MLLTNTTRENKSAVLFLPDGTRHQVPSLEPIVATFIQEPATARLAKNKRPGTPGSSKYVLLSKSLASWGKVPRQQADVASIIASNFEVGAKVTEKELFDMITAKAPGFPSLASSVQDPTYVFRYYRGLRNDGKYAGFVAREFLKEETAQ